MAEISIENIADGFFAVKEGKLYRVEFPVNLKPSKWIDVITGDVHYPTNADRIKSMSTDELANFLEVQIWDLPWCDADAEVDPESKKCKKWDCVKCCKRWLQGEADHA